MMKTGQIHKTAQASEITKEQLEKISQFTRRPIEKEQLFVFSLNLCDNEVDRDFERFSEQSLEKLAALYLGTTGVFDHLAKAEHQAARIFETKVITKGEKNSLGQPYQVLKAWAYMVRCDKNKDLMLEIDAGIKKEVSVGCAVAQVRCSVCGSDQRAAACHHKKGKRYENVLCYHLLDQPTDAYEWSFVAVPAQRGAGVTKRYEEVGLTDELGQRLQKASGALTLSTSEVYQLQRYLGQLDQLAEVGQVYKDQLRGEAVRYASIAQPLLDSQVIDSATKHMTIAELTAFHTAYKQAADGRIAATPQLAPPDTVSETKQTPFKI